ncbi:hypothetical protein [Nonomuraea africana]|uniref:Uncharacterized protein n=1 Tax=Nonomuraea africana TaxID=46171 RepID=A0ABR9KDI9_9ACTN|nr:hypothetical protein [Nonomuraea africana]MBE1560071.1 hypothetical protein [Nonomuraea africana]
MGDGHAVELTPGELRAQVPPVVEAPRSSEFSSVLHGVTLTLYQGDHIEALVDSNSAEPGRRLLNSWTMPW